MLSYVVWGKGGKSGRAQLKEGGCLAVTAIMITVKIGYNKTLPRTFVVTYSFQMSIPILILGFLYYFWNL